MSLFQLGNGAKNDLYKKFDLYASHSHIEEKSDGSKEIIQKSLESSEESYNRGDGMLWNPERADSDPEDAHFRNEKSYALLKNTKAKQDCFGNKITEEKAVKTEDSKTLHGTSMIIDEPRKWTDSRPGLLDKFSSNSDPFRQLGSNNTLLLGGK